MWTPELRTYSHYATEVERPLATFVGRGFFFRQMQRLSKFVTAFSRFETELTSGFEDSLFE